MNFEMYTSEGLFKLYLENIKTVATALREILDDQPMPDPREIAERMSQMSLGEWDAIWIDLIGIKMMQDNLTLLKTMAQVQMENADIVEEMLSRTVSEEM